MLKLDQRKLRVGDLIVPIDAETAYLFTSPEILHFEHASTHTQDELLWDYPAIVIEITEIIPVMEYDKIVVLMGEQLAWSYSDWVMLVE